MRLLLLISIILFGKIIKAQFVTDDPTIGFTLQPGENAEKKIKDNLFVTATINKKVCYPGEAILVTFKLFTRMLASSDVVKNPGLYGFTIYDMENLQNNTVSIETINGKPFKAYTIRKAQLFALQAGTFTIDPMVIKTKVAFTKEGINCDTANEISEGVLHPSPQNYPAGSSIFENTISTLPITVNVLSLPSYTKSTTFSGAVGNFSIEANVLNKKLHQQQEGTLILTIKGSGNFLQLNAPTINWPAGVEGFSATVKDKFNTNSMPLSGSREFYYPFVVSKKGNVQIPAIIFSFFNLSKKNYEEVKTKPIDLTVEDTLPTTALQTTTKASIEKESERTSKRALIFVLVGVGFVLVVLFLKKKEEKPVTALAPIKPAFNIDVLLAPAFSEVGKEGTHFYTTLRQCIWQYISEKYSINGTGMQKEQLSHLLQKSSLPPASINYLLQVIRDSELALYSVETLQTDNVLVFEKVKEILVMLENEQLTSRLKD
jgi:hypothetical protein